MSKPARRAGGSIRTAHNSLRVRAADDLDNVVDPEKVIFRHIEAEHFDLPGL